MILGVTLGMNLFTQKLGGEVIYFDQRWEGATGIGRFCREVAQRLRGMTNLPVRGNPASAFDCIRLTLFMLLHRKAFVVSPGYSAPIFGLSRFVLTVHDLNHVDIEHNSGLLKRAYYRLVLRRACRRAARVLTVSEFSRARIIDWAGVSPDQVVCVGNGVSEIFLEGEINDTTRVASDGYLLCVGNRKGHKNEAALLRCLAELRRYPHLRVIFSGEPSLELLELGERLGVGSRLSFTGPLTEARLRRLYREAALLVFPSLYEGFGLPAVEAMAAGCPVIASATTALGEIAGEACLRVDPSDDLSIAAAISMLIDDAQLRANLQSKGLQRCSIYRWPRVADKVQSVVSSLG